jgi:hypothetical protein
MNLTGTATFNLDLGDTIEEAYERCGQEVRSGYDFRTARRSLNLLTIEWANRGINLWTIEEGVIPLVTGQITYDLPVDTIDLLDHVIRTGSGSSQTDINISRISSSTYATIPNKNATGRPVQLWIDRQSGAINADGTVQYPQVNLYPAPNQSDYYLVYWRLRRIQDAGNAVNGQDIPFRLLNALIAGLAYFIYQKQATIDPNRLQMLQTDYASQLDIAIQEDREKASLRIVPQSAYR